jgi:uncharacterized protein YqjF (DUF2071 family)
MRVDLQQTSHRTWPLPARGWSLHMVWHELAFLHWAVEPAALERHLPEGLRLDTFEGRGWLGVVPFRMSQVRPRYCPSVPGLSAFPEINLRTYVTDGAKPGVWFFSLDVTSAIAVGIARAGFNLPYFRAAMSMERAGDEVRYASRRRANEGAFAGSYAPTGPVQRVQSGSLEEFLTERYCLYSANRKGRLFRGEIHHAPWPLQPARFDIHSNTMAARLGLELPASEAIGHYAERLDVVAWGLDRV